MLIPIVFVHETSNGYKITGLDVRGDVDIVDGKMIQCTEEVYNKLRQLNNIVDLGLGYATVDSNTDSVIKIQDIKIDKEFFDSDQLLTPLKESCLVKARQMLRTRLGLFGDEIYDFLLIKEYLELNGYKFSIENKAALIKEIMLSGDQELIDATQDYINGENIIKSRYYYYRFYKTFKKELAKCRSKTEIDALYAKYCEHFF